eukprot:gene13424-20679_t
MGREVQQGSVTGNDACSFYCTPLLTEFGDHELKVPFEDNVEGLTSTEATARLEKYGRNELPEKITPGWKIFLKGLWGPMAIALWVAIVIEF